MQTCPYTMHKPLPSAVTEHLKSARLMTTDHSAERELYATRDRRTRPVQLSQAHLDPEPARTGRTAVLALWDVESGSGREAVFGGRRWAGCARHGGCGASHESTGSYKMMLMDAGTR